jgi:uncharacterized protein (TIRG00374 family)
VNRTTVADLRRRHTLKLLARGVISCFVSGFFIWLSLRHTDLRAVTAVIVAAKHGPLIGYFAILLVVHIVRTVRWGLLLSPMGRIGFKALNAASAVGFMMLMVLPIRLGELARPMLVTGSRTSKGNRLEASTAVASCVVERVIDGLTVGAMGILALYFLGAHGRMADFARHASWLVAAMFVGVCLALIVAVLMRDRATRLLRRLLALVAPRFAERVVSAVDSFIAALSLGSALQLLGVFSLTVLHWSLHVVGFTLLAPAFGMHLTLLMACAVLAIQTVGMMVPAGPGMVGTSQFFTQAGLSIFVSGALTVPEVAARAAAYANAIWMLQFGQQVGLGLVFWLASGASLAGLKDKTAKAPETPRRLEAKSSIAV